MVASVSPAFGEIALALARVRKCHQRRNRLAWLPQLSGSDLNLSLLTRPSFTEAIAASRAATASGL